MVRLATEVANMLRANTAITAIAGARVFDRDFRDHWEDAPVPVENQYGVFLPSVFVVMSADTMQIMLSRNPEGLVSTLTVWAVSNLTETGFDDVDLLMQHIHATLRNNQAPSKAMLVHAGIVGPFSAPDGAMGSHTWRVVGIPSSPPEPEDEEDDDDE